MQIHANKCNEYDNGLVCSSASLFISFIHSTKRKEFPLLEKEVALKIVC